MEQEQAQRHRLRACICVLSASDTEGLIQTCSANCVMKQVQSDKLCTNDMQTNVDISHSSLAAESECSNRVMNGTAIWLTTCSALASSASASSRSSAQFWRSLISSCSKLVICGNSHESMLISCVGVELVSGQCHRVCNLDV